jgi:3-oxoacyl-[acyl-carrier protein] reductase
LSPTWPRISAASIFSSNNAGLFAVGPVDATLDTSSFDRQQSVNVTGVIAGLRAASRVMTDGGRIISMSSGTATRVGGPGMADYASTKAAIEGYSKGAARDPEPTSTRAILE